MDSLTDTMMSISNQQSRESNPDVLNQLENRKRVVDTQIDRLVYEMYGLPEDEIRVVESATPSRY